MGSFALALPSLQRNTGLEPETARTLVEIGSPQKTLLLSKSRQQFSTKRTVPDQRSKGEPAHESVESCADQEVVAASVVVAPSSSDAEEQMLTNLDQFFSNSRSWEEVVAILRQMQRVAPHERLKEKAPIRKQLVFRVHVPKPYPGIRYRRSKSLDDKYPRYAKDGSTVVGFLDESGEWLCICESVFLPVRVGFVPMLQPVGDFISV